ncbi:hypothetical protein PG999_006974 [Apiospora kogelbergensis]|uniref:Vacuolar ATPase assembly protein VMA22 n=1 Tax=Apiospora kogelbergensis TaxID=1337665 RepID=A0AAW0QX02_9PEZI
MEERDVDHLLEQYLHLLHEYTRLRAELNKLQAGIYQNLARANFAAERGLRYGQDQYDDRMRASRRVVVAPLPSLSVCPTFEVVKVDADVDAGTETAAVVSKSEAGTRLVQDTNREQKEEEEDEVKEDETEPIASSAKEMKEPKSEPTTMKKNKDPLRWFGLITPMPLRQAQAQSVQAVEDIVPKLVSINAEMTQVEIEVRRARKKRAKAEAAAKKSEDATGKGEVAA